MRLLAQDRRPLYYRRAMPMVHATLTSKDAAESAVFDWGRLYWYANGAAGSSEHQTVGRCVIEPGQQNPRHCHPNCEEVLHLLSGHIKHFVEGRGWLPMLPGDTITIGRDVWHHARNVGPGPAEMIICFSSPDRQTIGEDDAVTRSLD